MDTCFQRLQATLRPGQSFTYDLEDLGRYYQLYRTHGSLGPGVARQRFHVAYEELVRNTETVVRGLIAHCGLEFEPSCLRFHETRVR